MIRSSVLRGVLDRRPFYALLASAWGVPAAFGVAAERFRRIAPIAVPIGKVSCSANSSSDKGDGESRMINESMLFRRRSRTGSEPTARREEGEEEENIAAEMSDVSALSTDRVMRAFGRWSARTGNCSVDEFVQGVQQSYYGLGVLLGTLSESARPHHLSNKTVSLSDCVGQLKALLSKQYGLSPEQMTAPTENSSERKLASPNQEENLAVKEIAQALRNILPISQNLAESLFHIWNKQCTGGANLFCVAAPTDFVVSTKLIFFHECQKMQEVYLSENSSLIVRNVTRSSAVDHDASKDAVVSSESTGDANGRESTSASNGAETDNGGAVKKPKGHTIITYNGQPLPAIPPSAIACVVAMVDVIIPPQRYLPSFEWFYQRLTGHQSEYERIAAARIFAKSNARPFVAPLDFIMRMFTGRHVEFMCANGISEMIGVPKNIEDSPPATRKLMCLYMDADRRWVLSDIFAVDNVFATEMTNSAGA